MVRVVVGLYPSGCLKSLTAEGHAGPASPGSDPVCAAVSVLIRTALNVLEREPEIDFHGDLPGEGQASITVASYREEAGQRLLGVTRFLLTGLSDLADEYPQRVSMRVET